MAERARAQDLELSGEEDLRDMAPVGGQAGRGIQDLPEPAREIIRVEGSAAEEARPIAVQARLFEGDAQPRLVDVDDLPDLIAFDENLIWVDVSGFNPEGFERIADLLDVPKDVQRSAIDGWQRPRLAVYGNRFSVSVTVPQLADQDYRVEANQLDLLVGRNYLLSSHKLPLPFSDGVISRSRHSPELVRLDSAYMLYIILDELLSYFEALGEHLQDLIERIEERALAESTEDILQDILALKRYVFALSQLAEHHRPIFNAFLRPDFPFISENEVEAYFRDLADRLASMLDLFRGTREDVNGAFDIYVSRMTHHTNTVIRTLTVASTILFSAAVIVGLFSTNIRGIPLYEPLDLWIMLGLIVVVSTAILLTFRLKRWI